MTELRFPGRNLLQSEECGRTCQSKCVEVNLIGYGNRNLLQSEEWGRTCQSRCVEVNLIEYGKSHANVPLVAVQCHALDKNSNFCTESWRKEEPLAELRFPGRNLL